MDESGFRLSYSRGPVIREFTTSTEPGAPFQNPEFSRHRGSIARLVLGRDVEAMASTPSIGSMSPAKLSLDGLLPAEPASVSPSAVLLSGTESLGQPRFGVAQIAST